MDDRTSTATGGVLIWDLPTRLFHWTLVLTVAGAFLSAWFYQVIPFWVHRACGLGTWVLVVFRLLWGFGGTRHARFADFVRGPRTTLRYLRDALANRTATVPRHTPAGGWMVLLLLALLAGQATLGLFSNDETDAAGPLVGWISHAASNGLTAWHHKIGTALWIAIAIHVAAIVGYRVVLRDNLTRSLWTGRRNGVSPEEGISEHRLARALALLILAAAVLATVILLAPPVPDLLM